MRLLLARASLQRHSTRTALAALGVAVAMAMLLDMVMLSSGMRESFRRLLLSKGFELRLSPKGTLPFDTDATIANASNIVRVLRSNPAVELIRRQRFRARCRLREGALRPSRRGGDGDDEGARGGEEGAAADGGSVDMSHFRPSLMRPARRA